MNDKRTNMPEHEHMTVDELISELTNVSRVGFGRSKIVAGKFVVSKGDGESRVVDIVPVDGTLLQVCCNGDGSEWYVLGTGSK